MYKRYPEGKKRFSSSTIKCEEGNVCASVKEQQERWRRHFRNIINIQSEFSMEELEMVKQRPMRLDMERLPSRGTI